MPAGILAAAVCMLLLCAPVCGNEDAWEKEESRKLFDAAGRHAEAGETAEAISKYSEIIEFFPDCGLWPESCVRLSCMYLLNRQTEASEELLSRYCLRIRNDDSRRGMMLSHWKILIGQEKYDLLLSWLKRRSALEKAALRELGPEICASCPLEAHYEILEAMGFKDPLGQVIRSLRSSKASLDSTSQSLLLRKALETGRISVIRRSMDYLSQNGASLVAHRILKETGELKLAPEIRKAWLDLLISGKLWREAQELLAVLPAGPEYRRRRFLTFSGMSQWEKAYALISEDIQWTEGNISWDEAAALIEALGESAENRPKSEALLGLFPDSGSKLLLQMRMLPPKETDARELLLAKVLERFSSFGDRAYLDAAGACGKARKPKKALHYLEAMEKAYPESPLLKDAEILRGMVELIGGD